VNRARIGLLLAVSFAIAGCGITRVDSGPVEDFSTWSKLPLPADQGLMARALQEPSSCVATADGQPLHLLLQDRRTAWTAAFLFTAGTQFGSCFVTTAQGGAVGGSGPLPEAMIGALSIDENAEGGVASANAHDLGGRMADPVATVSVVLEDGQVVVASVGSGYWLAWWPINARATSVHGLDASGAEVERLTVPDPGAKS
jgi:hypothetical protein